jgi:ubiquitin C-terminal hydrolase
LLQRNSRYILYSDQKGVIGQFNETFKGNDQQDSQEFLAFLLDALHEDLNLSRIKGAKAVKEAEEPDDELPDEVILNFINNRYF